jgi:hypothetical protein
MSQSGSEPGVLQWINRMLPNCTSNDAYAQWAISNDIFRPIPKTQQCPTGYTYADSYDNHTLCKTTTRSEVPPEPLASALLKCASGTPGQAPSPVQVSSEKQGVPGWAIALIVIFSIIAFIGLGYFMYKSGWTPGLV